MASAVVSRRRKAPRPTPQAADDPTPAARSVWRGAASSLGLQSLGVALGMALQLLLARALGVDAFGRYAYAVSLLGMLHVVAKLGLDNASWRYIAEYRATGRWPLLSGFVRASRLAATGASLLIGGIGAACVALSGGYLSPELRGVLFVACLTLPPYVVNQLQIAQLVAWRCPAAGYAPPLVARPLLVAAFVGGLLLWRGQGPGSLTAAEVMGLSLTAFLITVGVSHALWMALTPKRARRAPRDYRLWEWASASAAMWGTSCLGLAGENLDVLLVGLFCGTTQAGIYAMASRLARLVNLGLMSASAATIPLAAELLAANRRDEVQRVARHSAMGLAAFTIPIVALLVTGGRWLLGLLGPEFAEGYAVLVILSVGQLVNALTGACGQLLNAGGQQGLVFRMNLVASAVNAALLLALTPTLGMTGAALAGSLTMIVWNLVLARESRRRLGIDSTLRAAWSAT